MNYPLISEYVEAIKLAQDNLDKLSYLRPVLDVAGNPIMSSGNFAVVFKMKDERNGELHALKCFIKEQEGRNEAYKLIADELEYVSSDFITSIKYLEKELFVDTSNSDVSEFPVLLMNWVEGLTLDKYIHEHLQDQYALHFITFQFCRLASWLMAQPFAHGDLKPDNIIVKADGTLVLVDYDGMFVPAMKGQKAREIGSPDFRHPLRTIDDFNEHIDDFSLATIAMQLYAIALQPNLLTSTKGETLLLSEVDYRNLSKCQMMPCLLSLVNDAEFAKLLGIFFLSYSENSLSNVSFRTFNISKPAKSADTIPQHSNVKSHEGNAGRTRDKLRAKIFINKKEPRLFENNIILFDEPLSTKVSDDDIANGVKDEFGAVYSRDGMRLLKGVPIQTYKIRPGTKVICDKAFGSFPGLFERQMERVQSIIIPDSVTIIGDGAFDGCGFSSFEIPESVDTIGAKPFARRLNSIENHSPHFFADQNALYTKDKQCLITFFGRCYIFDIPDSVTRIYDFAFYGCKNLNKVTISNSVISIGKCAFQGCGLVNALVIPNSVISIGEKAFFSCIDLTNVTLGNAVTHIGKDAFSGCYELRHIYIPKGSREKLRCFWENITMIVYLKLGNTLFKKKVILEWYLIFVVL